MSPGARTVRGIIGIAALGLVLSACGAAPQKPTGAAPLKSDSMLGATEESPGVFESPVAGPSPTTAPGTLSPTSLFTPFTCPQEHSATVYTSRGLKKALASAGPGDVIDIEPGNYFGHFTVKARGTAKRPIYLCGSQDAVLNGRALNHGYVLHLDGAEYWRMDGFTVEDGLKGIMMDAGKSNILQNLRVQSTGQEGIHLRKGSSYNVIQNVNVRKTGRQDPKFGEGIYVGSAQSNWCDVTDCKPDRSDRNILLNNKIFLTSAESIDIKEGTSSGVISGNTFDGRGMTGADSWVDVKGNNWKILGNHGQYSGFDGYQVHVILKGWGTGNQFTGNSAVLVDARGVGFFVQKKLTNKISCNNTATGAKKGLSNVPCSP